MPLNKILDRIEDAKCIEPLLLIIGGFTLFKFSFNALISCYKLFIRRGISPVKLGKWAVVTGATDGIGKAYAMALARKGLSIVLISRTEEKLKSVEHDINMKYGNVKTKYVVCDYSNFDGTAKAKVNEAIKDLDIGILVNNVGISYPFPMYFDELSDDHVAKLIEMNVTSTTWMTRMVIKGMADRKRGAIINISSAAGVTTSPLLAQYSAAKAYIEKFSLALAVEYKSKNISVQCEVPFWIATKLAKLRQSFMVPTPEQYVKLSMKWIGHSDVVISPFWGHALQGYVVSEILPSSVANSITLSIHAGIRKKGLKKEAAKREKEAAAGKTE